MPQPSPAPPPDPPSWLLCGHGTTPEDPVGCLGIHVPGHTACLAHLTGPDRDAYLASLTPGTDIDHRGTPFTPSLLAALLHALHDPATGHPRLGDAEFGSATFEGDTGFNSAAFEGNAEFLSATFKGYADFGSATFKGDAEFGSATFERDTGFNSAAFEGNANFVEATFKANAELLYATFKGNANFQSATFEGKAAFLSATFEGYEARFNSATFKGSALFSRAAFELYAWFESATFEGTADFGASTFQGDASFLSAAFKDLARLGAATFEGRAVFDSATFERYAEFDWASFEGDADFESATFTGYATFEATFKADAGFESATFERDAGFGSATFEHDARFVEATFKRKAEFASATFEGTADFVAATFEGLARFESATFKGDARFGAATFEAKAVFGQAAFECDAWFVEAAFRGDSEFESTAFKSLARFESATFERSAGFDSATFEGDADFGAVTFERALSLGPLVCAERVMLSGAVFRGPVTLSFAARHLECRRTRWSSTAEVRLRYTTVDFAHAVFEYPLTIAAERDPFVLPRGGPLAEEPFVDVSDTGVRVASLRGVDAAHLVLADVDLSGCLFAGTVHLDQVRLEGSCSFDTVPIGTHWRAGHPVRFTRRRTLAEEHHWRARQPAAVPGWTATASGAGHVGPTHLAPVYRALRKAFEDGKNEPGAADFYYGEMEMRRHDRTGTGRVERGLLHGYWMLSGYGLRASRALGWLAAAMLVTIVLLMGFGLPNNAPKQEATGTVPPGGGSVTFEIGKDEPHNPAGHRFTGERFEKALNVTLNSVVFRSADQDLTTAGTYIEMASRLAEPVLLGLAVLAIRNRVKR
ncbi:Pentapeptide repeat-containing protein [Streptomyces sp. cf386]|uniref:pentapeptide repeat-containing protein n=1 Tax=Streptomyces sp. cf386 TaxID=1761904 RepID=UPI000886D403|nr:pentapeptide repeat-containing protein [Streptomyces sp. cf386]SDM76980.1 Pentapeptide repeat-containing protein [Streptomyces sp. cf386]